MLDDPAGQDLETVRRIRDEIDARVAALIGRTAPARCRPRRCARCSSPRRSARSRSSSPAAARSWSTRRPTQLGHVGVAITFGLVIMAMIYAVGHVSGAHFNAAVTFAFALTRHFPWPRAVGYWARAARRRARRRALLRGSLGNIAHVGATLPSGSQAQSFLWELVMSAFLMFVILAVATDTRAVGEAAAIAIGGTIGLDAMFGGPISGASMNPMRSLGPALVSGDLHALWLYIVAPLLGACGRRARLPVRPRRDSRHATQTPAQRQIRRRAPTFVRSRTRIVVSAVRSSRRARSWRPCATTAR